MSTVVKLAISEFDRMIESGVFEPDRRVELIRGELREMVPIGPTHEDVVDILTEWSLDHAPRDQVRVRIQNSIGIPQLQSVPEPDVVWVARQSYRTSRPVADHVHLLIEVAHSSLAYDRGEKSDIYSQAGIRDYWIVNLSDWSIEVRRSPDQGKFRDVQTYRDDESISPLLFPAISLPVALLFGA